MANLTVVIDDDLLRRARVRAIEQGTSVNAVLREYLQSYAGRDAAQAAGRRLVEFARTTPSRPGRTGRDWTRDELHER